MQWTRTALGAGLTAMLIAAAGPALTEDLPVGALMAAPAADGGEMVAARGLGSSDLEDLLSASLEGNTMTVTGSTATSDNSISSHAFDGATGIVNAIQNNGNNVVIQNVTLVTIGHRFGDDD